MAALRALSLLALVAAARGAAYEVRMRDGVTLHTDVDEPPFTPAGKRLPAVLERSPYGDTAEELIALVLAELLGYVGVRQDMRGTHQSNGSFAIWHDSAPDAYDTLAWITAQPWSNGDVFTAGVSADGIDEFMQLPSPHPALRAQFVVFATTQAYETFWVGGAYRESLIDGWLKDTVPTQYAAADALARSQETPGGPWWAAVNGSLWYGNVDWPSVAWGGWYDIFQQGQLAAFTAYQARAAPGARGQSKLVVDPCGHCQAAADLFPYDVAFGRVLLPLLLALDLFADDSATNRTWPAPSEGVKDLTFYVMGADAPGAPGNHWTTMDAPPAPTPTDLFFTPAPGGGVAGGAPAAAHAREATATTSAAVMTGRGGGGGAGAGGGAPL